MKKKNKVENKAIEWNRRADDSIVNMPDVGMMAEELKKELDKYKIEKENKK